MACHDCAHGGIGGQDEQQHHQRVRDVAPIECDRGRRDHEDRGGDEAGDRSAESSDDSIPDDDRECALEHLGQDDRPGVQAEDPDRERLKPERSRQFVEAHRSRRIERAKDEVVPAHGHATHRRCVVDLEIAPSAPRIQECGDGSDTEECWPRPGRLIPGVGHCGRF